MKIKVQLYDHNNRGRAPSTRWGRVQFDAAGYASLEVEEADLPMLRALKWLVEPPQPKPAAEAIPDVPKHDASPEHDAVMAETLPVPTSDLPTMPVTVEESAPERSMPASSLHKPSKGKRR